MVVGALSSDQVLGILFSLYRGTHPKEVAKAFKTHWNTVYAIKAGRVYAKITAPYRDSRNDETRIDHEEHNSRSQVDGDVSIPRREGEAYGLRSVGLSGLHDGRVTGAEESVQDSP